MVPPNAAAAAAGDISSSDNASSNDHKEDIPQAPPRKTEIEKTSIIEEGVSEIPEAPPRRQSLKKEMKTVTLFDSFNSILSIVPFINNPLPPPTTTTTTNTVIKELVEPSPPPPLQTTEPPLPPPLQTTEPSTLNSSDFIKKQTPKKSKSGRLLSGSRRDRISRLLYISVVFLFLIFICNATYVSISVGIMAHMAKHKSFMNNLFTIEEFSLVGWENATDDTLVRPKCHLRINFKPNFLLTTFRLDLSNIKVKLSFPHAIEKVDIYSWIPLMQTEIDKIQFGGFDFSEKRVTDHIDIEFYLDFNTKFPLSHLITYLKEMKEKGKNIVSYIDIDFEVSTRSYLVPVTKIQIANNKAPIEIPTKPNEASSGVIDGSSSSSSGPVSSSLQEMINLFHLITENVKTIKFHDTPSIFGCRAVIKLPSKEIPSYLKVEIPAIYLDGSYGNAQSGFAPFGTFQLHKAMITKDKTEVIVDIFSSGSVHSSGVKSLLSSLRDSDFEGKFLKLQATPQLSTQKFFNAIGENFLDSGVTKSALQKWFKEKIAVSFEMATLLQREKSTTTGTGTVTGGGISKKGEKKSLLQEISSLFDDAFDRNAMSIRVLGITPESSLQTRFIIRKNFLEKVFQCKLDFPTLLPHLPSLKLSAKVSKNFVSSDFNDSNVDIELRHVREELGGEGDDDLVFDLLTTIIDLRPMIELSLKTRSPGSSLFREALSLYSGFYFSANENHSLLCRYLSVFSVLVTSSADSSSDPTYLVCFNQQTKRKDLLKGGGGGAVLLEDGDHSSSSSKDISKLSSDTTKTIVTVNHFINMELLTKENDFSFNIDVLFSHSSLSAFLPYIDVKWNQITLELYHVDFLETKDIKLFSFIIAKGGFYLTLGGDDLSPIVSLHNGGIECQLLLSNEDGGMAIPHYLPFSLLSSSSSLPSNHHNPFRREVVVVHEGKEENNINPSIIRGWKSFLHYWYQTDRLPLMQMRILSPNDNEQRFTFTIPPRLFVDPKKTSVSQVVSKVLRTQVSFSGFHENALALFFELPNLSHFLNSNQGEGECEGDSLLLVSTVASFHISLSLPSINLNGCAYPKNRMECFSSIGIKPCKISLSASGDKISDISIEQQGFHDRFSSSLLTPHHHQTHQQPIQERNRLPLTVEVLNLGGLLKIAERLLECKESEYAKMRSGLGWTGTSSARKIGGNHSFLDRFVNSVGEGIILDIDMRPSKEELKRKKSSINDDSLIKVLNSKIPASLDFKLHSSSANDFKGKVSLRIPEALLPTLMNGDCGGGGGGDTLDYPKVMSFKWGETSFSFKYKHSYLKIKLSKGEAMVRLDGLPNRVGSGIHNSRPISPKIVLEFHLHVDGGGENSENDFHTRIGRLIIDEINGHFKSPSKKMGRWLKKLLTKSIKFEVSMLPYDGNLDGFEDKTHKMKTKIPFNLIFKAMKIASKMTEKNERDSSNMDFSILMKPVGLPSLSSVPIPCFIPHLCPPALDYYHRDDNSLNSEFMGASISVSNLFQPMVDNFTAGIGSLLKLLELREHPKYIKVSVKVPEIRLNAIINEMDAIGVLVEPMDIRRSTKLLYSTSDIQKANRLNRKSCPLTISDDIEMISVRMSLPSDLVRVGTLLKPLELNSLFFKDPLIPRYSPLIPFIGGNGISPPPSMMIPSPLNYSPLNFGFSTENCAKTNLFSTIVSLLIPHTVDQPIPIVHIKPTPAPKATPSPLLARESLSETSRKTDDESVRVEILRTTKDEIHLLLSGCRLDKILPPFLALKLDKGASLIIAYKGREYIRIDFGNISLLPGMNVIDLPISLSKRGFNLPVAVAASAAQRAENIADIALFSEFITSFILRKNSLDFSLILQVTSNFRTFIDFSFEGSDHFFKYIEENVLAPLYAEKKDEILSMISSKISAFATTAVLGGISFLSGQKGFASNKESVVGSYLESSLDDTEESNLAGYNALLSGGTTIERDFIGQMKMGRRPPNSIPLIWNSFDEFNLAYSSTFTYPLHFNLPIENPLKASTLPANLEIYGIKGILRVSGIDLMISSCQNDHDRLKELEEFLSSTHRNPVCVLEFGGTEVKNVPFVLGVNTLFFTSLAALVKTITKTGMFSLNIDPMLISFGLKSPSLSRVNDEAFQIDYLLRTGNIELSLLRGDDVSGSGAGFIPYNARSDIKMLIPNCIINSQRTRISLFSNQIIMFNTVFDGSSDVYFSLFFKNHRVTYLEIKLEKNTLLVEYIKDDAGIVKERMTKEISLSQRDVSVFIRLNPSNNEILVDFVNDQMMILDSSRFPLPFKHFLSLQDSLLSLESRGVDDGDLQIKNVLPDLKNSQLFHLNHNSNYVDERSIMLLRLRDIHGVPLSLFDPLPKIALAPIDFSGGISSTPLSIASVRYIFDQNIYEIIYSLPKAGRYEIKIKLFDEWYSLPYESVYCRHSW